MHMLTSERRSKYYFVLPALVFVGIMVIIPVAYTLLLSFTKWSMAGKPNIVFLKPTFGS